MRRGSHRGAARTPGRNVVRGGALVLLAAFVTALTACTATGPTVDLSTKDPQRFLNGILDRILSAGSVHLSMTTPPPGVTLVEDEADWVAGPTPEDMNWSEELRDSSDTRLIFEIVNGVTYAKGDKGWLTQDPDRTLWPLSEYEQAVRYSNPWAQFGWMSGAVGKVKQVKGPGASRGETTYALTVNADEVGGEYGDAAALMKKTVGSRGTATITLDRRGLPVRLTDVTGGVYAFRTWGKVAAATAPPTTTTVVPASPGFGKRPTDGAKLKLPAKAKLALWISANERKQGSVHFHISSTASLRGKTDDGRTSWHDGVTDVDAWGCLSEGDASTGTAGFCTLHAVLGGSVYSLTSTDFLGLSGTKRDTGDPESADAKELAMVDGDATQHVLPLATCITAADDRGVGRFDQWLSGRHVHVTLDPSRCGALFGEAAGTSTWTAVDLWLDGDGVPLRATYSSAAMTKTIDYDSWHSTMDLTPKTDVLG